MWLVQSYWVGGHVSSMGTVGTEGVQLNSRWEACESWGSMSSASVWRPERMKVPRGCDYCCTQFLLSHSGAVGYRQVGGNSLTLVREWQSSLTFEKTYWGHSFSGPIPSCGRGD